ncbi:MAG TPA: glutathione S-transferase family protein [Thermoanaerobaculia bacterium]|nr:glutathione S-transferase family protein [Thermoanaerobaculia bacterium]
MSEQANRIRIFGVPMSRAARVHWMARELGLDAEHVPIGFADGSNKTPEYLALNPNGRLPTLEDGGLVLWESMAINLYLARKYGPGGLGEGLAPRDLEEDALAMQWSFWVMTEIEKPLLRLTLARLELPEDSVEGRYFRERVPQGPEIEAAAEQELERPLAVLDGVLADREFLVAERFTVADLNVASVMAWSRQARLDLSRWPNVAGWLARCLGRSGFRPAAA